MLTRLHVLNLPSVVGFHRIELFLDSHDRDVNRLNVRATVHIHWTKPVPKAWVCSDRGCDELFGCFHCGNQVIALRQSRRDCS